MNTQWKQLPDGAKFFVITAAGMVLLGIVTLVLSVLFGLTNDKSDANPGDSNSVKISSEEISSPEAEETSSGEQTQVPPALSVEEQNAIYQVSKEGYQAFCTLKANESFEERAKRIRPYTTTDNTYYNGEFYNPIVSQNDCVVIDAVELKVTSENTAIVLVNSEETYIYEDIDFLGSESSTEEVSSSVSLRKENGVWLVSAYK